MAGAVGGKGGLVPDHNFRSKNYHFLFLLPFDAEAFKTGGGVGLFVVGTIEKYHFFVYASQYTAFPSVSVFVGRTVRSGGSGRVQKILRKKTQYLMNTCCSYQYLLTLGNFEAKFV